MINVPGMINAGVGVGFLSWPGGSVGWSVIPYTKSFGFDSQPGHIPGLQIPSQSPVGRSLGGNWRMVLTSFLSPPAPHPLSSLSSSKIKHPQMRITKRQVVSLETLLCNLPWMFRKAGARVVWKDVWMQINELNILFLKFSCTKYLLNFTEAGFICFVLCSLCLISSWSSWQGFPQGFYQQH